MNITGVRATRDTFADFFGVVLPHRERRCTEHDATKILITMSECEAVKTQQREVATTTQWSMRHLRRTRVCPFVKVHRCASAGKVAGTGTVLAATAMRLSRSSRHAGDSRGPSRVRLSSGS
jgi:hypothetical protein